MNETGIADGEIAVFNPTNKDIRTSDVTIATTLGSDNTTVPTSLAVKQVTDAIVPTTMTTKTNTDYTVLDNDGYGTILFSTGSSNRTCTLPTAADNVGRELKLLKSDAGAGYLIIDGEGAETINGVATITAELQFCGLHIKCDGVGWFVVGTLGECEIQTIGSAIEIIYLKTHQGTNGAGGTASFAHGVPDYTTITTVALHIKYAASTNYYSEAVNTYADATNININGDGNWVNSPYTIEYKYYI